MDPDVKWGRVLLLLSVLTLWYGLSWILFPTIVNSYNGVMTIEDGSILEWIPYVKGAILLFGASVLFIVSMSIRARRKDDYTG